MASALLERVQQMVDAAEYAGCGAAPGQQVELECGGSVSVHRIREVSAGGLDGHGIFIVAMIGGGITFIDDKSRGLHEGYLLTPIHKTELVLGLIGAGAIKGLMAGMALTMIGGLMVGIPRLWDPVRCFICFGGAGGVDRHDQLHVSG